MKRGFGARGDLAGKLYSVTHCFFCRRLAKAAHILSREERYQFRIEGPNIAIRSNTPTEAKIPHVIAPLLIGGIPHNPIRGVNAQLSGSSDHPRLLPQSD